AVMRRSIARGEARLARLARDRVAGHPLFAGSLGRGDARDRARGAAALPGDPFARPRGKDLRRAPAALRGGQAAPLPPAGARGLRVIDLRSDTVTRPSPAMRRAMAEAAVGDDVFEEDPTVRDLESRVAELLGFPAALFTPSGTMANQVALRILAPPATEVLMEERSHPFHFEMAGMAALSGLLPRP